MAETDDDDHARMELYDLAADEAERVKDHAKRRAFTDAFKGREKVDHHLEPYLSTMGLVPDGVNERRGCC